MDARTTYRPVNKLAWRQLRKEECEEGGLVRVDHHQQTYRPGLTKRFNRFSASLDELVRQMSYVVSNQI